MTEASDIARREQYIESALERIAELEAERDRLRAALQGILELKHEDMYHGSEVSHAHAIAREALDAREMLDGQQGG